jgi:hypothetical protein
MSLDRLSAGIGSDGCSGAFPAHSRQSPGNYPGLKGHGDVHHQSTAIPAIRQNTASARIRVP